MEAWCRVSRRNCLPWMEHLHHMHHIQTTVCENAAASWAVPLRSICHQKNRFTCTTKHYQSSPATWRQISAGPLTAFQTHLQFKPSQCLRFLTAHVIFILILSSFITSCMTANMQSFTICERPFLYYDPGAMRSYRSGYKMELNCRSLPSSIGKVCVENLMFLSLVPLQV